MTDPRIEAAARQVAVENGYPDFLYPEGMAEVTAKSYRDQAARIVAAADNAATITTAEGLDALPVGTVILDSIGLALQLRYDGCWWCTNGDASVTPEDIDREGLPARVIHFGGTE